MNLSTSASLNNTSRAFTLCRVISPWSAHRNNVRVHTPNRDAMTLALLNLNAGVGVVAVVFMRQAYQKGEQLN
jgi:hypothetical protein